MKIPRAGRRCEQKSPGNRHLIGIPISSRRTALNDSTFCAVLSTIYGLNSAGSLGARRSAGPRGGRPASWGSDFVAADNVNTKDDPSFLLVGVGDPGRGVERLGTALGEVEPWREGSFRFRLQTTRGPFSSGTLVGEGACTTRKTTSLLTRMMFLWSHISYLRFP